MIEAAGADSVVDAMIDHFGITESGMRDIIARSGPFLFRAHQHWMDRPGGLDELNKLVRSGGPQQFADMATQRIAKRLDIDLQKLEEMMPNLAALFVGVLCKSMTA